MNEVWCLSCDAAQQYYLAQY